MGSWGEPSSPKDVCLYVKSILWFVEGPSSHKDFGLYVESILWFAEVDLPPTRISVCTLNSNLVCWGGLSSHKEFGLYVESILWGAEESLPPTRISVCTQNQYYGLLRKAFLPQGFLFVRKMNTTGCWGEPSSHKDFCLYIKSILCVPEEGLPPTRISVCT